MACPAVLAVLLALAFAPLARAEEDADLRAGIELYEKGDYTGARARWKLAAQRGVGEAAFRIGELYFFGRGVERHAGKAYAWYFRGAECGHAESMVNVGAAYWEGKLLEQDFAEALRWYRKAAAQGNAQAMTNIGVLYQRGQGVEQDYAEALRWHRKAARTGNAHAMYNVAIFHEFGWGIERDEELAAVWYRGSAAKGFPFSMLRLGGMLYDGRGAERDLDRALSYFRQAHEKIPGPVTAARIWLCLLLQGKPKEATTFVQGYRTRYGAVDLPLLFACGEVGEDACLGHAAGGSNEVHCRTCFYLGSARLAKGDEDGARELLERAISTGAKDCDEYRSAEAELARLRE